FTPFQTATSQTQATFTGIAGHTYGFCCVATDNLGNVQHAAGIAQATITVDTTPPTSNVSLPAFSPGKFTVSWSGNDNPGGAGITCYDVYVSDNGGRFKPLLLKTKQMLAIFIGQPGHLYRFFSVATDVAGNRQGSPSAAQASTRVDTTPPASRV